MSRDLRSNCGIYDDAAIHYDGDDRMFYAGDTFDRIASCYASLDSLNTVQNSIDALEGRVSASEDCLNYLNNAMTTMSTSAVSTADSIKNLSIGGRTISLGIDDLNERLDALSKKVDDLISGNSFGNSFLKSLSRIKRSDFKTLNR